MKVKQQPGKTTMFKAMRNCFIYAILCYAEFRISGHPEFLTVGNSISENPEVTVVTVVP